MCLFLLMGLIFAACLKSVGESDIWWHLRNARYLLQYHSLPRVDMYSFGAAGSPWLNHEWLSEIPFYLGFETMGLQGLVAVYFVVIVLIFTAVYYLSCRAGADCKDATVVTAVAIAFGWVSIGPRMLLFGWLCMVALLLVLDRFQRTGKGLWLLPPLFALWINLHGSWVFGMVVLVVTIASGLVEGKWGLVVAHRWSALQLKKLFATLALSLAALFVNPFGYKLPLYPFDLLFRQQTNLAHIQEWQSVDFNTSHGKLAMIMIIALLAAALFSRRRWRLDEVILAVFALFCALSHLRLLFFAGLILPPILAPRLKLFPPYDKEIDKPWLNAVIMGGIIGSMIFFFPPEAKLQQEVNTEFPTAALEFMQQKHLRGRIFNPDSWGGYMEWNTPGLKPFIDGRADIFVYRGIFDEYGRVTFIKEPFEILNKYAIEYVLFQPRTPLSHLLDHSTGWKVIYADSVAKIYQRVANTGNAAIEQPFVEAQQPARKDGSTQTSAEPAAR
jgi:hypothetical protein